jgi:hypothetical protein
MKEIRAAFQDDRSFIAENELRYERCRQIQADSETMESARTKWFDAAVASGHPLAVARKLTLFGDDRNAADAAIRTALKTGRHEAYELAAIFVENRDTDALGMGQSAEPGTDAWVSAACKEDPGCDMTPYLQAGLRRSAPWDYLSCKTNMACDLDRYVNQAFVALYGEEEVKEIEREAHELENQMAFGRWDEVEL